MNRNKIKDPAVSSKFEQAIKILARSLGRSGIYAGSGPRYKGQYWTRDMALVLFPAVELLNFSGGDTYVSGMPIGSRDLQARCARHIEELVSRQGPTGAIPVLFTDDIEKLVYAKLSKCRLEKGGSLNTSDSFVLTRILEGYLGSMEQFPEFEDFPYDREQRGLYRLTPGTTDSELMFASAVYSCSRSSWMSDDVYSAADLAIKHLEDHYVRDGLHHGADWRDTMEVFFRDKPLLTNNVLLFSTYRAKGDIEKAAAVYNAIERTFWNGETYLDYPGATRFDPLGASLAVLHGIVPHERYGVILAGFQSVDTPHGVTIECRHNPHLPGEAEVIDRTNGIVVWPFVVGFTIMAALEMGEIRFAQEQFIKLHDLEGFAEWYDPKDGKRWGEYEQGWSAAMYIRVVERLTELGFF